MKWEMVVLYNKILFKIVAQKYVRHILPEEILDVPPHEAMRLNGLGHPIRVTSDTGLRRLSWITSCRTFDVTDNYQVKLPAKVAAEYKEAHP